MTTITLRMDDEEKKELDQIVKDMGLTISTFYSIYTKRVLRDRRIPFDLAAGGDPFYSPKNMKQLAKADQQVKEGRVVTKSMADLEAMANG